MGQSSRRLCHTQDITYDATVREWQPPKRTTRIDEVPGNSAIPPACDHAQTKCRALCGGENGINGVDEVLVVHHEALKKVNFLLRVDELSGCDLPTVPECVVAAKQAELQKKHLSQLQADPWSRRAGGRSKSPGMLRFDAPGDEHTLVGLDSVLRLKAPLLPKLRNLPQHRAISPRASPRKDGDWISPRASPRKDGDEPRSLHNDDDDFFPDEKRLSALIAASALMKGRQQTRSRDAPSRDRDAPSREQCAEPGASRDEPVAYPHDFEIQKVVAPCALQFEEAEEEDEDVENVEDAEEEAEALSHCSNGSEDQQVSQHDDDILPDDSEKVISVPLEHEDDAEGPSCSLKRTQIKL